jgi:hypothetical protein
MVRAIPVRSLTLRGALPYPSRVSAGWSIARLKPRRESPYEQAEPPTTFFSIQFHRGRSVVRFCRQPFSIPQNRGGDHTRPVARCAVRNLCRHRGILGPANRQSRPESAHTIYSVLFSAWPMGFRTPCQAHRCRGRLFFGTGFTHNWGTHLARRSHIRSRVALVADVVAGDESGPNCAGRSLTLRGALPYPSRVSARWRFDPSKPLEGDSA